MTCLVCNDNMQQCFSSIEDIPCEEADHGINEASIQGTSSLTCASDHMFLKNLQKS